MNKYISAFIGGIFGTVLGALLAWFLVFDPNSWAYVYIRSLPKSFQEPATNIFVFFGLVVCSWIIYYFIRMGYTGRTKEEKQPEKKERKYIKFQEDEIFEFLYRHVLRFAIGLATFVFLVLIYEINGILFENAQILFAVFMVVIFYTLGYAVLNLWNLTWGEKIRKKLDEWEENEEDMGKRGPQ